MLEVSLRSVSDVAVVVVGLTRCQTRTFQSVRDARHESVRAPLDTAQTGRRRRVLLPSAALSTLVSRLVCLAVYSYRPSSFSLCSVIGGEHFVQGRPAASIPERNFFFAIIVIMLLCPGNSVI